MLRGLDEIGAFTGTAYWQSAGIVAVPTMS